MTSIRCARHRDAGSVYQQVFLHGPPAPAGRFRVLALKFGPPAMPRQASHSNVQAAPKNRPRDPVAAGKRDASVNRAASHNYFLLDRYEAGVALRGTEVKSIREGNANLKDAYGLIKDGEAFLLNAHIGPYSHGNISNHDAVRTRKLLLHHEEIRKLIGQTQLKGHTLIPTRLYFRH